MKSYYIGMTSNYGTFLLSFLFSISCFLSAKVNAQTSLIGYYPYGIAAIGSSYNDDDHNNITIVASQQGDIIEYFYPTGATLPVAIPHSTIAHFDHIISIASFYAKDDHYRIVIVATANGDIHEVFYSPVKAGGNSVIAHYDNLQAIAAFYAEDDHNRIVIAATKDGNVHEIFYNPVKGKGQSVIAHYDNITSIAAAYYSNNNYRCVVTATSDKQLHFHAYLPAHPAVDKTQFVSFPITGLAMSNSGNLTVSLSDGSVGLGEYYDYKSFGLGFYSYASNMNLNWMASNYTGTNVICTKAGNTSVYNFSYNPPPTPVPVNTTIASFTASPNNGYIPIGSSATLKWNITNCGTNCKIIMTAVDGFDYEDLLFSKPILTLSGSMQVTPTRSTETKFTLTATGSNGSAHKDVVVQLAQSPTTPPSLTVFYFRIENPNSQVCKCYTLAVPAKDQPTADAEVRATYPGFSVTPITLEAYTSGCSCF